jgi:hypothetical protein
LLKEYSEKYILYLLCKLVSASLRLGGEKFSYDTHCLVVGDAAGMIDPLTGKICTSFIPKVESLKLSIMCCFY